MGKRSWPTAALALVASGLAWAQGSEPSAGRIDQARLLAADKDLDNWLEYGRTYAEQRYSPLAQVNDGNVGQLGLAFAVPGFDPMTAMRMLSASPWPAPMRAPA